MSKEKKITIKHFLNKRLKPRISASNKEKYPVYTSVTYNRQTTALNLLEQVNPEGLTEEEFQGFQESLKDPSIGKGIHRIEKAICMVIRYEEEYLKEGFKMKGFSKRLEVYFQNVTDLYGDFVTKLFARQIEPWISVRVYRKLFKIEEGSYDFYPKSNQFELLYFSALERYIPDIEQRLKLSPHATSYTGYIQWLCFENMKGNIHVNPYRGIRKYNSKRFSLIEWINGDEYQDYIQFLEKQTSDRPYQYQSTESISPAALCEKRLSQRFPAQKQYINHYIQQIKTFVPKLLN